MIAIPNMDKPKSCYNHCLEDFIANEEIGCPLKDYAESHQYKNSIHPNCPIIEIVTCGECKKVDTKKCPMYSAGWGYTNDDWCSEGERRNDE